MRHVWIVTTGVYSDYGICAIFSTEAKAEEYTERFKERADHTGFDIVRWPLDQLDQLKGKYSYHVQMSRNGDVLQVTRDDVDYRLDGEINRYSGIWYNKNLRPGRLFWASVTTDSEEAAIKITNEKRVQFIAANKWNE